MMETCRPCGCRGWRSCLICENEFNIHNKKPNLKYSKSYVYCPYCCKAWLGWDKDDYKKHPYHDGDPLEFPGIYIQEDFLTKEEEQDLMSSIDSMPWDASQSGRRKQNFGPKCNFKKRRLDTGAFRGFPSSTLFIQQKFRNVPLLNGFQTIEQCSLEYCSNRGASIDPHVDDCWVWGERVVTVNLLSDSVLTMTINEKTERYNLDCVQQYSNILNADGSFNKSKSCYSFRENLPRVVIRVPMSNRSLLVMYGPARYDWEHQILREDIVKRRVCLAYREFTPPYLPNGSTAEAGNPILEIATHLCIK